MDKYLVCIGSNTDQVVNLEKCRFQLSLFYFQLTFSDVLETAPIGDGYVGNFLNQLVVIESPVSQHVMDKTLDEIEKKLGRLPDDKAKGIIKIDIDLLAVNKTVIKPEDFERPYIPILLQNINYSVLSY